jgi:hypothetical protein
MLDGTAYHHSFFFLARLIPETTTTLQTGIKQARWERRTKDFQGDSD